MADIILKMLSPSVFTYHIKNRQSFRRHLEMPTIVIDMPERPKEDAQITKLAGNILKFTILFLLDDWTGKVATLVDELTGASAILTPQQQVDFLLNTFENKSILAKYNISIENSNPPFSFDGIVDNVDVEQSKETADKERCIISFSVGKVITVEEE